MPIFEYVCAECDHAFEFLLRGSEQPACPACHGHDLKKQLSVFAVSTSGPRSSAPTAGPCGSCGDPRGPGSCSLN
jgi:putative FmdB family regulatory protein